MAHGKYEFGQSSDSSKSVSSLRNRHVEHTRERLPLIQTQRVSHEHYGFSSEFPHEFSTIESAPTKFSLFLCLSMFYIGIYPLVIFNKYKHLVILLFQQNQVYCLLFFFLISSKNINTSIIFFWDLKCIIKVKKIKITSNFLKI